MRETFPRTWEAYEYFNARSVLVRLRKFEAELVDLSIEERVLSLRTRGLRTFDQRRQGALFCYGLSCSLGRPVAYAPVEDEDYDCIARWQAVDGIHFAPMPLKELPPESINRTATLDSQLAKLTRYVAGADLAVAIYLNRQFRFNLASLAIPGLPIGSLWVFGGIDSGPSRWMLWGDLLANPRRIEFE